MASDLNPTSTGEARFEAMWQAIERLQAEHRELIERATRLENELRSIREMIEDGKHH